MTACPPICRISNLPCTLGEVASLADGVRSGSPACGLACLIDMAPVERARVTAAWRVFGPLVLDPGGPAAAWH
jgi:hypothetical protein